MSALGDRRRRAREAYRDTREGAEVPAVEVAIETATRVRITPEIVGAARWTPGIAAVDEHDTYRMLAAAFRAAGFEIEE
jgi:predicted deacylase